MFRQADTFAGGWNEKTIESMRRKRFENRVRQLSALGAESLENIGTHAFQRKLEHCWQEIEKKPIRKQQEASVKSAVLLSLERHADCLSHEEHELVERALILGGSVQINDLAELDAAMALSLRFWAHVGLVDGKPYLELEPVIKRPVAQVFASEAHERIRRRFGIFHEHMAAMLYQAGVMDDRYPQQMILREVLSGADDELSELLARYFLWASYDCVDYAGGVLLVHGAFAEPERMIVDARRKNRMIAAQRDTFSALDILPEEIPLERKLEQAIQGVLRDQASAHDVARAIRFICKQGAPLQAMEDVLQSSLIVCVTPSMRTALREMYYSMTKWAESREYILLQ